MVFAEKHPNSRIPEGDSHHSYQSYLSNKRKTVFAELDENPSLTPKQLARIIGIPSQEWKKEYQYLKKLRHDWRGNHQNERGSIRSCPDEEHNAFYRGELPVDLVLGVRSRVVEFLGRTGAKWAFGSSWSGGWKVTKSKNHFLLYVLPCVGRIRVFDSGTVEVFVYKPASDEKCFRVFNEAFVKTDFVTDIRVLRKFEEGLMRRCHATFDTGQRLPYMKITAFRDSHNLVMISGDRTHRTSFEFWVGYNREVEMARSMVAQFGEMLKSFNGGSESSGSFKSLGSVGDYSR